MKPTVADTDGDGLSDGDEVNVQGTNPLLVDTDGDDMPDAWEVNHGLSPLIANAFDDADGDRYPNVFEYARSTDPSDAASIPTPNYTVNAAGGGTHTTVSAALNAANITNGAYQIIGIAPGTYTGGANLRDVTVTSSKPKVLFIGLEGAQKTIIDGALANYGWLIQNAAVVSSLTFRKVNIALGIDSTTQEVRFVDLVLRDNDGQGSYPGAVQVTTAANVHIVGCTFVNNTGSATANQIWFGGPGRIVNTVVVGSSGAQLAHAGGTTLTTNNSLVTGQTLTGTGNLPGTTDPKLRTDLHLLPDSPLRGAGGSVAQSRVDFDGEARPSAAPDIGVDQFVDSDADGLADFWEIGETGNLTTLTASTQDADGDGLSNAQEYAGFLEPTIADTDGDGISDGDELNIDGTNPLLSDTDGDGMPDGWELAHGFSPLVANGFDDADGDRYPNVFEYARSTDPNDAASVPTPNYTVDAAGGGTHTTISAALGAADVANGAYQIIGIAPGTYTGGANLRDVTVTSSKPKLLFIGLGGAGKTIIDGGLTNYGWLIQNAAVVSSLTFQKASVALGVDSTTQEVRFVDLVVRDNLGLSYVAAGVHVTTAASVHIIGSTFINNTGGIPTANQIWFGGPGRIVNTVVVGTSGAELGHAGGTTLTTSYSLVTGQTLTGAGNLAGTTDPKLRSDLHLRSDSPLRGAGGTVAQSRVDFDGETRPSSGRDIGADSYFDSDADGLPDFWELANAGSLAAVTGSADPDADGLTNLVEYDLQTNWLNPDTDGDLVPDGVEVAIGSNPLVYDSDNLLGDLNGDGIIDTIGVQLGIQPTDTDSDGDGVSNADELLMGTDPLRADTDGDGVADNIDAFPTDPLLSALPNNPSDVTPPVIMLIDPWYAVAQ